MLKIDEPIKCWLVWILVSFACFFCGFLTYHLTLFRHLEDYVEELNLNAIHNAAILNSVLSYKDGSGTRAYMVERIANVFYKRGYGIEEAALCASSVYDLYDKHHLPPSLIVAVIDVESGFDKKAVSSERAMGLMQIVPSTGMMLAELNSVKWGDSMLFAPDKNIMLGGYYLAELRDSYEGKVDSEKVISAALAAYNAGPGFVNKRITEGLDVQTDYVILILKTEKKYIKDYGLF